jgi:hypothetical protein
LKSTPLIGLHGLRHLRYCVTHFIFNQEFSYSLPHSAFYDFGAGCSVGFFNRRKVAMMGYPMSPAKN